MGFIEENKHGLRLYKFNHRDERRFQSNTKALELIDNLKATNRQLLEALEAAYDKLDGRHDNIHSVLSAKSVISEAITNAKQTINFVASRK